MYTVPHVVDSSYERIYISKLKLLMQQYESTGILESVQDTFCLTDPTNNVVKNAARKFNLEFALAYAKWIWSGETDIRKLDKLNANAKKFDNEYKGRFASYGPRVVNQVDHVLQELRYNPDSRRACIMILDERDQLIADGLRLGETRCEYPCTMGITFFIREEQLHAQATMRSNNYVLTSCIDVFLFTTFQEWVAEELGLAIGKYYHTAVNAHMFSHEVPLVRSILLSHNKNNAST